MFHIIDDEEMVAEVHADILNSAGFETLVFTDSVTYIDYVFSENYLAPLAIFTDLQMPHMNGLDLIHKVQERFPLQRVVVLSGYSDQVEASWQETCRFLFKPFSAEKLIAVAEITESCEKEGLSAAIPVCRSYHENLGIKKWDCPFNCTQT